MKTLLLDRSTWDLVADAAGNIACASDPYSQSQDAASAVRLFNGELYYDTSKGIPYFTQILGRWPPLNYVRQKIIEAAMTVPGVVSASCFFTSFKTRALVGQIQVSNGGPPIAARFVTPIVQAEPTGSAGLDFSNPANSQYLPGGL